MKKALINSVVYSNEKKNFHKHFHNSHEIIFVKRGEVIITVNGYDHRIGKDTLFIVSNLEHHSTKIISDEYERYCIQLSPQNIRKAIKSNVLCSVFTCRPEKFSHSIIVSEISETVDYIFQLLLTEMKQKKDFSYDMQKSLIRMLLITLYRYNNSYFPIEKKVKNDIVEYVLTMIEQDYSNKFTLDQLSTQVHVSKSHLSHMFKEVTGYGIIEYLTEYRLSIAEEMLCYTHKNITQIAYETGFSSSGNFTRYLKKVTNLTPKEYRNQSRQGVQLNAIQQQD